MFRHRVSTRLYSFVLFVLLLFACGSGSSGVWAGEPSPVAVPMVLEPGSAGLSSLPAPAQAAFAAALGRDHGAYHAERDGAGWRFDNPEHGLGALLVRQGVELHARGSAFRLRFQGLGRGSRRAAHGPHAPQATANRVEYRRGAFTEWYVNGPLGLEQGYTLDAPPRPVTGEALTVALILEGDVRAEPAAEGLDLIRADGTVALRYRGLAAWDRNGRVLPAWWQSDGVEVFLRVDDTGARYPVTIDPFFQRASLSAGDGTPGDALGFSVAASGDTVVVGAPEDGTLLQGARGSAYVFVKPSAGWAGALTQIAKLTASDGRGADRFGFSVAVDGDTIVVGARGADVGVNADQGAAYVYVKPPAGWTNAVENAKLTVSDGAARDRFGISVAISGDTVVGGAFQRDVEGRSDQGMAYVFVKPPTGWVHAFEDAALGASDGLEGDNFGHSVGVSGATVAVGAPGADAKAGSAYVFVKPVGTWIDATEDAKLTALGEPAGGQLGFSVAVNGDTVVVGAPGADGKRGSAYVFVKPPGGWSGSLIQNARLMALARSANDLFGDSVTVAGERVVVGASGDDGGRGSAALFLRGPAWSDRTEEDSKLTDSDGEPSDDFGSAVAVGGDAVVVGSPGRSLKKGVAYVFTDAPDPTPPEIAPVLICTQAGQAPWCRGTARVTWNVTDPESEVTAKSGCNQTTITTDTPANGRELTCTATSAGGTASRSVTVFRDATAPTVNLVIPGDGNRYGRGTTVFADFACTDASSGIGVGSCNGTVQSGSPIDTGSVGTKSFTVTATDRAGNTRSTTHTYQVIDGVGVDMTPPDITPTPNCSLSGAASWCRGTLSVTWTVSDAESPGSITTTGCGPATITSDTPGTELTCTATSTGGTQRRSFTMLRDATPPIINLAVPANGQVFEIKKAASARFDCTDATSGMGPCSGTVASGSRIDTSSLGTRSFTVTATDQAGNPQSITHAFQVVDRTPPVIKLTVPKKGARYTLGSRVRAKFKCTDAGAGISRAKCRGSKPSGGLIDTSRVGKHRFKVTAIDKAGIRVSRTHSYSVVQPPSGGGGSCGACSTPGR